MELDTCRYCDSVVYPAVVNNRKEYFNDKNYSSIHTRIECKENQRTKNLAKKVSVLREDLDVLRSQVMKIMEKMDLE